MLMPKLNKRKLSVLLAAALIIVAIICWYHSSNANSDDVEKTTDSLLAMDTYMTFTVYGDHAQTAINEAKQLIKDREIRWSVTDGNSEINKLNASGQLSISPETVEILSLALQYSDYSNHCFDPTVYPLVKAWGFTTGNYRIPEANELSELLRCVGTQKFTLNGNNAVLSDGSMLDLGGIAKGFVGDLVISSLKSYGVKSSLITE